MDSLMRALLSLSRYMNKVYMTADGIVSDGPCYLFDAHLAAAAGGATTNILYHGTSTAGKKLLDLHTVQSTSFNYWWFPPLFCPKGLYLDVGSNLTSLAFHILEMKE